MTVAPERPTKPGKRTAKPELRPGEAIDWWGNVGYCGYCAGWCEVKCPDCGGFPSTPFDLPAVMLVTSDACRTCKKTGEVPCPQCAGGSLEKWIP